MEYISAISYVVATDNLEMKKLKAGFLLKEMLNHFTDKISSRLNPDRSLWIYSGHRSGLVNLLNSLNLFDEVDFIKKISELISSDLYLVLFSVTCFSGIVKHSF